MEINATSSLEPPRPNVKEGFAVAGLQQVAALRNGLATGNAIDTTSMQSAATTGQQFPITVGLNGAAGGRIPTPSARCVSGMSPENNNNNTNNNNNDVINGGLGSQYRTQSMQPSASTDRRVVTCSSAAGAVDERQMTALSSSSPSTLRYSASTSATPPGPTGGNGNATRTMGNAEIGASTGDAQTMVFPTANQHHPHPFVTMQQGAATVVSQHQQQPPPQHLQGQLTPSAPQTRTASTVALQRCAACGREIADRFLLHAIDRYWHTDCLRCSACQAPLADIGSTCFTRAGMTLCRSDYMRMYGPTGTCRACRQPIPPNEFVMKTQQDNAVYHVTCFACVACHSRLVPGDRYGVVNGRLVCEQDYVKSVKNQLQHHPPASSLLPHGQQLQGQQQQQQQQQQVMMMQQQQTAPATPRVDAPLNRQHHKVC